MKSYVKVENAISRLENARARAGNGVSGQDSCWLFDLPDVCVPSSLEIRNVNLSRANSRPTTIIGEGIGNLPSVDRQLRSSGEMLSIRAVAFEIH